VDRELRRHGQELGGGDPEDEANQSSQGGDDDRLAQELQTDITLPGANRSSNADFHRPLLHREEEQVCQNKSRHDQRNHPHNADEHYQGTRQGHEEGDDLLG